MLSLLVLACQVLLQNQTAQPTYTPRFLKKSCCTIYMSSKRGAIHFHALSFNT